MSLLVKPPLKSEVITEINRFDTNWMKWFSRVWEVLQFSGLAQNKDDNLPGLTVVITTAPVTGGGAAGSMTFQNGILVAQTQAT